MDSRVYFLTLTVVATGAVRSRTVINTTTLMAYMEGVVIPNVLNGVWVLNSIVEVE